MSTEPEGNLYSRNNMCNSSREDMDIEMGIDIDMVESGNNRWLCRIIAIKGELKWWLKLKWRWKWKWRQIRYQVLLYIETFIYFYFFCKNIWDCIWCELDFEKILDLDWFDWLKIKIYLILVNWRLALAMVDSKSDWCIWMRGKGCLVDDEWLDWIWLSWIGGIIGCENEKMMGDGWMGWSGSRWCGCECQAKR